jgi:threonine-phosphate decarboxylase
LAEQWDVDPACIIVGNGATELIHFLARVWPQPETTLAIPIFSEFHRAYPQAALVSLGDAPDTGLLIYSNPATPTGELTAVPERSGPTIVDESFIEFTDAVSRIGSRAIVLRSLTKFHALPGLRIGALAAPADLAKQWRNLREPWQVNILAEAAALAALQDTHHASRTRDYVNQERERVHSRLLQLRGVTPAPSQANYIYARLEYNAGALCKFMLDRRILLRNCTGWPGLSGEGVRLAIRSTADNDRLLDTWRSFPCD